MDRTDGDGGPRAGNLRSDPPSRSPWARRATAVGLLGPLVVAGALTGAAVLTVAGAGCEEPGSVVPTSQGHVLVGGCAIPGLGGPDVGPTDGPDVRRG